MHFNKGDVTQSHTIIINDDSECENATIETFLSSITLDSGIPVIDINVSQATITIDDINEVECGKPAELLQSY